MNTNINTLLNYLDSIHSMSPELRAHLASKLKVKNLEKGQFLLREGNVCQNVYFIVKGLVRAFIPKSEGQLEVTNWFMMEKDVIFSVLSFYRQAVSRESLECLKDSEFLYISYDELQFIGRHFAEFNHIRAELTQIYYAQCEERWATLRLGSAEERYDHLHKYYSPLLVHVTQAEHQASFLAMSYRTYMRIRKARNN